MLRKLLSKRDAKIKQLVISFAIIWFASVNVYFFVDLLINRREQISNLLERILGL